MRRAAPSAVETSVRVTGSGRSSGAARAVSCGSRDAMRRPVTKPISLVLGIALAASTGYLLALLFAYVFGVGHVRRHHVETASYLFAAAAAAIAFRNGGRSGRICRCQPGAGGPCSPRGSLQLRGCCTATRYSSDCFPTTLYSLNERWLAAGWVKGHSSGRCLPPCGLAFSGPRAVPWHSMPSASRCMDSTPRLCACLPGAWTCRRQRPSPPGSCSSRSRAPLKRSYGPPPSTTFWRPPVRLGSCSWPNVASPREG